MRKEAYSWSCSCEVNVSWESRKRTFNARHMTLPVRNKHLACRICDEHSVSTVRCEPMLVVKQILSAQAPGWESWRQPIGNFPSHAHPANLQRKEPASIDNAPKTGPIVKLGRPSICETKILTLAPPPKPSKINLSKCTSNL